MASQRSVSLASPVTVTISSGGKGEGVTNRRSMGPSSPAPGRSFSTINPTSPISGRLSSGGGGGRRYSTAEEAESTEFVRYTVQIPATPDHHLSSAAPETAPFPERSYISGTLFTGGFNCVTRGHVINSSADSSPQVVDEAGLLCRMNGCDGEPFFNRSKQPPCECGFLICKDCYFECNSNGGKCPGCKEPYRLSEEEDLESEAEGGGGLPLTSMADFGISRRLSMMKSVKGPSDFDHNRWLFETKGTYGYGNAVWPKDGNGDGGVGGFKGFEEPPNFSAKNRRPLTRKISVSQAIISPYR